MLTFFSHNNGYIFSLTCESSECMAWQEEFSYTTCHSQTAAKSKKTQCPTTPLNLPVLSQSETKSKIQVKQQLIHISLLITFKSHLFGLIYNISLTYCNAGCNEKQCKVK